MDSGLASFEIAVTPASELVDASAEVSETQDAIEGRVASIRGLPAKAPIKTEFKTRKEFRLEIMDESPDEESRQEIDKLKDLCLILDLCTESDDLLEASQDLRGEGVIGYYDPEEKSLTLIPS